MSEYFSTNTTISPMNSPSPSPKDVYLKAVTPPGFYTPVFSPNPRRPINHSGGSSSIGSNKTPRGTSELSPVEEDVLVMDGIPYSSEAASRFRSLLAPEAAFLRKYSPSSSSSVGSGGSYKTTLCMFWKETGGCRRGYKCKYAHGEQELRPVPSPVCDRNIQELQMSKSNSSPLSSVYNTPRSVLSRENMETPSPLARPAPALKLNYASPAKSQIDASPAKPQNYASPSNSTVLPEPSCPDSVLSRETMATPLPLARPAPALKLNYASPAKSQINASPAKPQNYASPSSATVLPEPSYPDWNPLDDGIGVTLPSGAPATKEAVDEHIGKVLYGSTQRKRLSVFADICPE